MGVNVSYYYEDTGEPLGIYAAEGMAARSGSFFKQCFHGRADTAFTVVCRGRSAEGRDGNVICGKGHGAENDCAAEHAQIARTEIKRLLSEFEQWFCREFSHNLHPFSVEVVKRYWQSILGSVPDAGKLYVEAAVLLVHAGQYVFCNRGELTIYEYSYARKKYRRWHTGTERDLLDQGLGIVQGETAGFQFWNRGIKGKTLFLIAPKQVSPEIPPEKWNRRSLKRFADGFAGQVSGAAVIAAEGVGR